MATATYTPTNIKTDLVKVFKKVQTKLFTGFRFKCPEYAEQSMGKFDVDWSSREILFPLDLNEGGNVASIAEGGYEAFPSSPSLEEGTATWIQFNKRFTLTKIAQYIDEVQGVRPMVKRQFALQGTKALDAIGWQYGLYWYGFSTGVIARIGALPGGNVITLKDAYGSVGLASGGSAYEKAYLARMWKKGERIAILNPAGPALRVIQTITADPDTVNGQITLDGSAGAAVNDLLVYANSIENTTLAGGTDYNKGVPGLMEVLTSAGLHGLTHGNWTVAGSDVTAGRFNGSKMQKARDEIANWAPEGTNLDTLVIDQAVRRDTNAQYMAAVRYDDPGAIEIEGMAVAKKIKFQSTRRVPPGLVAAYASGAYKRMTLWDKADAPENFADGDKLQDQNAMAFMIDYPWYLICTARKAFYYWLNQQTL